MRPTCRYYLEMVEAKLTEWPVQNLVDVPLIRWLKSEIGKVEPLPDDVHESLHPDDICRKYQDGQRRIFVPERPLSQPLLLNHAQVNIVQRFKVRPMECYFRIRRVRESYHALEYYKQAKCFKVNDDFAITNFFSSEKVYSDAKKHFRHAKELQNDGCVNEYDRVSRERKSMNIVTEQSYFTGVEENLAQKEFKITHTHTCKSTYDPQKKTVIKHQHSVVSQKDGHTHKEDKHVCDTRRKMLVKKPTVQKLRTLKLNKAIDDAHFKHQESSVIRQKSPDESRGVKRKLSNPITLEFKRKLLNDSPNKMRRLDVGKSYKVVTYEKEPGPNKLVYEIPSPDKVKWLDVGQFYDLFSIPHTLRPPTVSLVGEGSNQGQGKVNVSDGVQGSNQGQVNVSDGVKGSNQGQGQVNVSDGVQGPTEMSSRSKQVTSSGYIVKPMSEKQFNDYVTDNSLQLHKITGNGFCFLHAVRTCLMKDYLEYHTVTELQKVVTNHLISSWKNYAGFYGTTPDNLVYDATEFFNNRNFTADVVDIIVQATANALDICMKIFRCPGSGQVYTYELGNKSSNRVIYLKLSGQGGTRTNPQYTGDNHYDSLIHRFRLGCGSKAVDNSESIVCRTESSVQQPSVCIKEGTEPDDLRNKEVPVSITEESSVRMRNKAEEVTGCSKTESSVSLRNQELILPIEEECSVPVRNKAVEVQGGTKDDEFLDNSLIEELMVSDSDEMKIDSDSCRDSCDMNNRVPCRRPAYFMQPRMVQAQRTIAEYRHKMKNRVYYEKLRKCRLREQNIQVSGYSSYHWLLKRSRNWNTVKNLKRRHPSSVRVENFKYVNRVWKSMKIGILNEYGRMLDTSDTETESDSSVMDFNHDEGYKQSLKKEIETIQQQLKQQNLRKSSNSCTYYNKNTLNEF